MKPNNPYNQALSDLTDYVNRRIKTVETDLDDCVDNDGSDKRFYRLIGRRNELAGLSLELGRLEQPDQPAKPEQPAQWIELCHHIGCRAHTGCDGIDYHADCPDEAIGGLCRMLWKSSPDGCVNIAGIIECAGCEDCKDD